MGCMVSVTQKNGNSGPGNIGISQREYKTRIKSCLQGNSQFDLEYGEFESLRRMSHSGRKDGTESQETS